jgi:3-oxoacyl-[acyl-carrier protein] reductase
MDLGLSGKRAILCASSRGLGRACAEALAAEGVAITINGRDGDVLSQTADEIRQATGATVTPVAADIDTPEGRAALLAACPEADILVNNNWGPPPKAFEDTTYDDWMEAINANMLAPLMMIQGVLPGMRTRRFGRIVNITSQMVKSPLPHMTLSAGARTGLTSACKALSRDCVKDNVTINNLLPERVDTNRQVFMAERRAETGGISFEEARQEQIASIAAGRLGRPEEFGKTCAFLCSAHVGYTSGQNIQLDGGTYRGLI